MTSSSSSFLLDSSCNRLTVNVVLSTTRGFYLHHVFEFTVDDDGD